MRRLPALVAALLLPADPPPLLSTAVVSATLLVSKAPAQAQSSEAVAKVAQAITVRIEGTTQGSAVLVKRDGTRYTVLTAWHVVSGQGKGEELDIFVHDGSRQQLEQGSIKRLGEVDLAVLTFISTNTYEVAQIGDVKSVSMGNPVWVSGFPLPSSAVPTRLLRFIKGDVIANATVAIPDGYQLLYDNQTLAGVSGGAVLNAKGQLVGIHGKAEKADQISESSGKAVATGTNQGVPISYYKQFASGGAVVASSTQATSADDYLAQAKALLGMKGREQEVIRLSNQVLAAQVSVDAFFYRAYAKDDLGDHYGAIADLDQAISLKPTGSSYTNRGVQKSKIGDVNGAIIDFNKAIAANPKEYYAYTNRCFAKIKQGDQYGAIADCSKAIEINPSFDGAYYNRGNAKDNLGDKNGAITDFDKAISLNPRDYAYYIDRGYVKAVLGDDSQAISDYNKAISLNPKAIIAYKNLGNAYQRVRNYSKACANWRSASSLGDKEAADWVIKDCK
ncbi:tetratricopeptide repeat protein [Cyanobium sp. BA20m-p-22]|uniref:tetratricopeptide repeat-containing S1 family peptidase n=1 Tax=Cyanobium sp. BA20m-p-22 TaxID=2823704 RepID=UPI0020CD0444|nr:tetratricopeptide repeat protein [Cyanobium sp. BA20m-p-22]MCP9909025.1 tetratricopeptide repeat protein [Cyanobium sp. BA20m-p-22]